MDKLINDLAFHLLVTRAGVMIEFAWDDSAPAFILYRTAARRHSHIDELHSSKAVAWLRSGGRGGAAVDSHAVDPTRTRCVSLGVGANGVGITRRARGHGDGARGGLAGPREHGTIGREQRRRRRRRSGARGELTHDARGTG